MIVNCAAYPKAGGSPRRFELAQVGELLRDTDDFFWVGVHQPSEAILDELQAEFDLHDLAVEDAHHAHQRPKIEVYGSSLFLALHTSQLVQGSIQFGETLIFLGERYLITIRHGASLPYAPARARCEREPEMLALGPSYALYAVLDLIVDNYMPLVGEFERELVALEQDIFNKTFKQETIHRLYSLKQQLVKLRLAVAPLQDILNQLVRFHPTLVRDEVRPYFRDVFDHAVRVNEATDTMREMLTAALSVNLALATVQQGEIVKRLAGWAGLLGVPTLVASWYGMNFVHMPELAGRSSYGVVIGVTATVVLALYVALKRAKWL
ncbi:MAG: magnesium and cobalt transport protein CorA [Xanthomonadales bacterium]|nr:magnesium and cobalt transport protein CorA [Xanthomonadales bacterium]